MTSAGEGEGEWSLEQEDRHQVVVRAAEGISTMCHARGQNVAHEDAKAAAVDAEQRAYDRAKIESKTTTGNRPRAEVERAYLRILSQNVLEVVKAGCKSVNDMDTSVSGDTLDLSSTGREFVSEVLARKLLQPLLEKGSQMKAIKLSTKSIGIEAAPVVADSIRNVVNTLERADVSDIIAGRPEKEVLEALQVVTGALAECKKLLHLNISDNALGEKGIRACAEVLTSSKSLEELYLQNIGCSVNACKAVAELVTCTSLRLIHLFNNMSDNAGAAHIATLLSRNTKMEDFKMVSSRVGSEGGEELCSALALGTSLKSFDISDNPMDSEVAPHIASLLPKHANLQRLILSDLGLGDEGIKVICESIAQEGVCPGIETIDFALNEISRASTPAVAAMLSARKASLRHVNLAENELECAGAIHIAAGLLGAVNLEVLDLKTNMIARVGAVAVAKACAEGMQALKKVELNDNQISEEGVNEIQKLLGDKLGELDENDEDGESDQESGLFEEAQTEIKHLDIDLEKLAL